MELAFREIEGLLAAMHNVAPAKRGALLGRLKHFQRLRWPGGTNLGKGARARYGVAQVLSLAVAFEMLQLGNTPERIVDFLDGKDRKLAEAFHEAVSCRSEGVPGQVLFVYRPTALKSLEMDQEEGALSDGWKGDVLDLVKKSDFVERINDNSLLGKYRRAAWINLSELLDSVQSCLSEIAPVSNGDLSSAISEWRKREQAIAEEYLAEQLARYQP